MKCTMRVGGPVGAALLYDLAAAGVEQVCAGTGNGTRTNDVYPGSPSKCNCGTLVVDIFVETVNHHDHQDSVDRQVPETGGSASYTVTVHNDADVEP